MSSLKENLPIKFHLAENLLKLNHHLPCLSKIKEFQAWPAQMEMKIKTKKMKEELSVSRFRRLAKTIYVAVKILLGRITYFLRVLEVECLHFKEKTPLLR
jgi:hypothetical protein